jgi:hypothetical protein
MPLFFRFLVAGVHFPCFSSDCSLRLGLLLLFKGAAGASSHSVIWLVGVVGSLSRKDLMSLFDVICSGSREGSAIAFRRPMPRVRLIGCFRCSLGLEVALSGRMTTLLFAVEIEVRGRSESLRLWETNSRSLASTTLRNSEELSSMSCTTPILAF